jgi:hypothetical protein
MALTVRVHCQELSFRQWTIGQHGICGRNLAGREKSAARSADRSIRFLASQPRIHSSSSPCN